LRLERRDRRGKIHGALLEAHPDAWVIGLDSNPEMVFRARETYDDVQLARMEDPLPDGPWDLVVLDCAPTAETLRLLALPEALSRYLDRMLPVERRVVRALSAGRPGRGGLPSPRDHVVEAAKLRVVGGAEESKRRRECAGADAGREIKGGPASLVGPAAQKTRAEGAILAAAGNRKQVPLR